MVYFSPAQKVGLFCGIGESIEFREIRKFREFREIKEAVISSLLSEPTKKTRFAWCETGHQ